MELKRRQFLMMIGVAAAAVAGAAGWFFSRTGPRRFVEAVRGRFYPGPVGRPDAAEIRKTARWAG